MDRKKIFLLIVNIVLFSVIIWFYYSIASQANLVKIYRAQHAKLASMDNKLYLYGEQSRQINQAGGQSTNVYKAYLKSLNEEQVVAKQYLLSQKNLQSKIFFKYIPEHKQALSVSIKHTNNFISQNEADIKWAQEAAKQTPDDNRLNDLLREADEKEAIAQASLSESEKEAQGLKTRVNISRFWSFLVLAPIGLLGIILFVSNFLLFTRGLKTKSRFISLLSLIFSVFNLLGVAILSVMIFL